MRWRKHIWGISQLDYWASLDPDCIGYSELSACIVLLARNGGRIGSPSSIHECSHEDKESVWSLGVQMLSALYHIMLAEFRAWEHFSSDALFCFPV